MNYYNPYFYTTPNMTVMAANNAKSGLFSRLFGGLSFGRIINGTERALNFANQAIPLVKQVKPIIGNAKTMFKVMNEFKRQEKPANTFNQQTNGQFSDNNQPNSIKASGTNEPTFFM